jgi:HD-like signal output (HDOD) protein
VAALVAELERSLAANTLELPSLPEVALKVRKALADESVSSAEIARLLGTDPALAARVLKTANSALFYRGSKPITSLQNAFARLGQRMVRTWLYRTPRSKCSSVTAARSCASISSAFGSTASRPQRSRTCWRESARKPTPTMRSSPACCTRSASCTY